MKRKTHHPGLSFVKSDWNGNPLSKKGRYTNLYGDTIHGWKSVLKWIKEGNPMASLKKGQVSPLMISPIENLQDKQTNAIIPLGHAGFIIDINKTRLVIDPILVKNRFLKRFTEIPLKIDRLNNIDFLLLSHNHRDHIDKKTVIKLCKQNPKLTILTGLEVGRLLKKWQIKNEIQEAGWYQRYKIGAEKMMTIDYLPSQHWSRRWLTDTNKNLWGSFMIHDQAANIHIYFASDSAYAPHFKQIGKLYPIDLAMIGIGAYEPQWIMKSAHTSPTEAIQAFKDLKAKKWMPMHYGTLDLSNEPIFYPEKVLRSETIEIQSRIEWMKIGYRLDFAWNIK